MGFQMQWTGSEDEKVQCTLSEYIKKRLVLYYIACIFYKQLQPNKSERDGKRERHKVEICLAISMGYNYTIYYSIPTPLMIRLIAQCCFHGNHNIKTEQNI